jgi:hypothetical protein
VNTVFKNKTGSYAPEELAVVVWSNPKVKNGKGKQVRALETMTTDDSTLPMVFPITLLKKRREWKNATFVNSSNDVFTLLPKSHRSVPLIIPMTIAKQALGWDNFYIPTEYTEE